jgi:restriction endonuclease S subunit
MSSYTMYTCEITNYQTNQKKHLDEHLESSKYKQSEEIFRLKLEKKSKSELKEKYGTSNIDKIINNLKCKKVETLNNINDEQNSEENKSYISISSKEAMKDAIHEIHNFLRNNGAGYGMNALKLFTLFYGLAKIEQNGHFEKTGLSEPCRFSNIKKEFKKNKEIGFGILKKDVLGGIYSNDKIKKMIFTLIPESVNPNTIGQLVNKINDLIKLEKNMGFQLAGKIYEYFIGRDQTAISEMGAYFTDRHITDYIYQNVHQPELDDDGNIITMIDPFGGSGGFTLGYISHLKEKYPDIDWKKQLKNVYHIDMNLDVVKYAMLEMYCLTGEFPDDTHLRVANSFKDNFKNSKGNMKFKNIYTNPPYGGDKNIKTESIEHLELIKKMCEDYLKKKYKLKTMKAISKVEKIDDKDKPKIIQYNETFEKLNQIKKQRESETVSLDNSSERFQKYASDNKIDKSKCNDKEAVSFLMMMDLLEEGGTAVGVLKEGVFFDSKYKHLRLYCVENFNVEMIVSIDASQFENTSTTTSIIKFSNTGKTKNIKFYELVIEKDDKTDIIEQEDGSFKVEKIKDRITNVYDKLVSEASYQDLVKNDYTFNHKKYNKKTLLPGDGYEMVKLGDIVKIKNGQQLNKNNFVKGEYLVYGGSSNSIGFHNNFNSENEIIITGTGTYGEVIYEKNKFWASQCFTIKPKKDIHFYFYLLTILKNNIKDKHRGTNQKFLRANDFHNFEIPIPKSEKKIKYWVDKINKPYNKIQESKEKLNELKDKVKNNIQKILDENETEEVELGELCEFKSGVKFTMSQHYKSNGDFGYIRIGNLNNSDKMIYLSKEGYEKCKNNLVTYNDILLSDVTEKTFIKFVPKEWNNYVHYGSVIRCFNYKLNKMFLYYFFNSKNFNNQRMLKESGSIQKHLTLSILKSIKITLPKNRKLIDSLNPLFEEIDKLNEELPKQEQLYKQYLDELKAEAIKEEINDDNKIKQIDV